MRHPVLVLLLLSAAPRGFANCYVLKNETSSPQTFQFKFNRAIPGMKPMLTLAPHSQYPRKGTWCWTRPSDYYALVAPQPGGYRPSWQGPLILGNRGKASPSGTYVLRALPHHETVAQVSPLPLLDPTSGNARPFS
jgi:hypothetical protein